MSEPELSAADTLLHALGAVNPGHVWAAAILAGIVVAVFAARRRSLDVSIMYWAGLCALLGAMIGGRALIVLAEGSGRGLFDYLRFWEGGSSAFGGFAGGALGAAIYLRIRHRSFLSYADAAAAAVVLAYAVARLGCLLNGDDFGAPSDAGWAVRYPPETAAYEAHLSRGWIPPDAPWSLSVHPVQLYSTAAALVIYTALSCWRTAFVGARVAAAAIAYGAVRFTLDFFRGDVDTVFGPLTLAQLLSVAMIVGGVALWLHVRRSALGCPAPVLTPATPH